MLDYSSAWPIPVCLALLAIFAATPIFRAADTPSSVGVRRIATLDGLRGFLAASVVIHHAAIYHHYLLTGEWIPPEGRSLALLGRLSVASFFTITSYLFWGRLLTKHGRPSWFELYLSRIFRIGPLYFVAAFAVIFVVLFESHFRLQVAPHRLTRELVRWLSLGMLVGKSLNGHADAWLVLAGVTWTLQYEWAFYFSLPFLAPLARTKQAHLLIIVTAIFLYFLALHLLPRPNREYLDYLDYFLFGMLVAALRHNGKLLRFPGWLGSSLLVCCILTPFLASGFLITHLAVGTVLYLVVCRVNLFGVLETKGAVRLGDISYGVYLLQGLVLAPIYSSEAGRRIALSNPLGHWLLCMLCLGLLALLAVALHAFIERPAIVLGKELTLKFSSSLHRPRPLA